MFGVELHAFLCTRVPIYVCGLCVCLCMYVRMYVSLTCQIEHCGLPGVILKLSGQKGRMKGSQSS